MPYFVVTFFLIGWALGQGLIAEEGTKYELRKEGDSIEVLRNGKMVASYINLSATKPILWPILGPDMVPMTRKYPMDRSDSTEKQDHIHHRSLWLTHGEVNGLDFWAEKNSGQGRILHQKFTELEASDSGAVIASINHWVGDSVEPVLIERRRFRFHGSEDRPKLDCQFELQATQADVHFGDTKEGTFGIRVNEAIKVEATPAGTIENSEGERDNAAWGKAATWVDYSGLVQGKRYGIAILCHPSSFRAPGRWHVRGYGLFAHNPFGLKDFVGDDKAQGGGYVLPKGEAIQLSYRIVMHRGDAKEGSIAEAYQGYAKETLESVSGK